MRRYRWFVLAVVVATAGATLGSVAPVAAKKSNAKSVTLNALFFQQTADGPSGGTNKFTVRYEKTSGKTFRVGFSEDEVAGTGDQWRAAGWNAAVVATLLTGAPLAGREVRFDVNGRIDGPSAGALMTLGLLSLIRGDKLKTDVTMTGTINPDGTVGPVGGIPYKVDGVRKAHKKRMLIPAGQRNSKDADGNLVDVVALARRKGIKVSEVADVYAVYKAFTGKTLPRPKAGGNTELSEDTYAEIKAKVKGQLADFQSSVGQFNSLDPTIRSQLASIASQGQDAADRAGKLSDQGLQAGAYVAALEAAALANAAVKTGRAVQVLLTQGVSPFVAQVQSSAAIQGKVEALVDELKNFKPKSVSDASALIEAYGNTVDALSLSRYSSNLLEQADQAATLEEAVPTAVGGAVYAEFAGTIVDGTKDVLDVGRGLGGPKLAKGVNLKSVADFFRKAAEANLAAFDTIVVEPQANEAGMNAEVFKSRFASAEFDYALAQSSLGVLQGGLDEYLGDARTASYARLGGAAALYARSAQLLAKYYSIHAILDDNLDVTGVVHEKALTKALDFGSDQVERNIALLRSKKVEPALVVAGYEAAGVDREGGASDKLDALGSYLGAFVGARILAYLGGFQTSGLK